MARHVASITVRADVREVYRMWMHFPDYPNFMSHVRSVSYIDGERTRWVVNIVGRHEWAAKNENWILDRQIGWRSIDGLENSGLVEFVPTPSGDTQINVAIDYTPPGGIVGNAAEVLGAGRAFERGLRADLEHFANVVQRSRPVEPRRSEDAMAVARAREGRGDTIAQDARATSTLAEAISSATPFDEEL